MNFKVSISVVALLLLAACSEIRSGSDVQDPGMTSVTFQLQCGPEVSRTTVVDSETLFDKVQVAVYNSAGTLITSGYASDGQITLNVPLGLPGCSVFALANSKADLNSWGTRTAMLAGVSRLGENKSASIVGLEMAGSLSGITFTADYEETIQLRRFAAKVAIEKVVNAIPTNQVLTIKGMYLINVNTACRYSFEGGVENWAQKRAYNSSESTVCPFTAEIFNATVQAGSTYSQPHYFYCYPNPVTTDSSAETWSPRFTRLVVEAEYGGVKYYYPVNIRGGNGVIDSNSSYIITKMTITGPGSDSPDKPISKDGALFDLEVLDWTTGMSQEVEI